MKRQAQSPGVKKWTGNDLLDLQHECLKIADNFLGQFGSCVVSGCKVNGKTITPGLVFIDGKVIPFGGASGIEMYPVYLKVKHTEIMREYVDNLVKPVAHDYTAELVTQIPVEVPYLTIEADNNPTFFEVLQNDSRLFMTKAERDKLRGIEAQANKIIVDSAISATSTNPVQNKVIKAALDGKAPVSHSHNYAGSASAGGAANSVKSNLVVKLNGGATEGTNQFTYNGSAVKTVNITPALIGAVPTTRKVNGKALSADINLAAADVSAVPTTRKVNGKALSADITLTAEDVGAVSGAHTHNYAGSASPGGAANSVKANLIIKLNGGATEGTNQFTFNGGTAKTANITPAAIGAVPSGRKVNGKALTADISLTAAEVGAAPASHSHNYAGSASAGGAANSVKANLVIKLNGGVTEGTNQFTFNGGTAKTANITPATIGAVPVGRKINGKALSADISLTLPEVCAYGRTVNSAHNSSVYGGAFEIREYGNVANGQTGWLYSPAITFHWGQRYAKRFGLRSDGNMAVDDVVLLHAANYSSYAVPLSRTINGLALSSNVSLNYNHVGAAAASHSHSYLPLSGGKLTGALNVNDRLSIDTSGRAVPHSTATRRAGMYGVYDATKIGHIWSMGTAYMIPDNGANFGNLYGLAYKHTNNATGGTLAGGHQAVWCENGVPKAALGSSGVWAAGGFFKSGSNDNYVLLGGGGHKLASDIGGLKDISGWTGRLALTWKSNGESWNEIVITTVTVTKSILPNVMYVFCFSGAFVIAMSTSVTEGFYIIKSFNYGLSFAKSGDKSFLITSSSASLGNYLDRIYTL